MARAGQFFQQATHKHKYKIDEMWDDAKLVPGTTKIAFFFRFSMTMHLRLHPLIGTDLHLSTFCCGLGGLFALPTDQSDAVLDAFVEAGGNFFDTAHIYSSWLPRGHGLSEIAIGDYIHRRGLKNVIVATKGGHPSFRHYRTIDNYLSPARVGADIDDSLARLECDSIALYYLHRDDP